MYGTVTGRFVRKPELLSGIKDGRDWFICKFSIAADNHYYNKTKASFYDCQISGKKAEAINKFFDKGDTITLHGKLEQEEYTTKENETRRAWRLYVDEFAFCGNTSGVGNSAPSIDIGAVTVDNDDIPF